MKTTRYGLRTMTFVLFLGVLWCAARASAAEDIAITTLFFESGGKRIQMERFQPAAGATLPAIVVLHGAGGTIFDGPQARRLAQRLAAAGHPAYFVHYFERTGTLFGLDAGMHKNFDTWLGTVRDSIVAVQRDRQNAEPIGIYGYSLGGFLALAASSDNARVGAVVEHAGGMWNGKTERIKRMPSVLVLHGKRDQRVPFVKYAEPLVAHLKSRGDRVETRYFADEGHVFSSAAMVTVRDDAASFFGRHLRR